MHIEELKGVWNRSTAGLKGPCHRGPLFEEGFIQGGGHYSRGVFMWENTVFLSVKTFTNYNQVQVTSFRTWNPLMIIWNEHTRKNIWLATTEDGKYKWESLH